MLYRLPLPCKIVAGFLLMGIGGFFAARQNIGGMLLLLAGVWVTLRAIVAFAQRDQHHS